MTNDPFNLIKTAEVFNIFPFDLGFSMTIHKAQGRTIPNIILDLSCHLEKYAEMKFAAIFVVMSGVRNKDDILLLSHEKKTNFTDFSKVYSYLTLLFPDDFAMAFYHGY